MRKPTPTELRRADPTVPNRVRPTSLPDGGPAVAPTRIHSPNSRRGREEGLGVDPRVLEQNLTELEEWAQAEERLASGTPTEPVVEIDPTVAAAEFLALCAHVPAGAAKDVTAWVNTKGADTDARRAAALEVEKLRAKPRPSLIKAFTPEETKS